MVAGHCVRVAAGWRGSQRRLRAGVDNHGLPAIGLTRTSAVGAITPALILMILKTVGPPW
jgi:hypothetical protein